MKTYSNEQFQTYQVSGTELRIHWNIVEVPVPSIDDEPHVQWEANEALAFTYDDRGSLISKIIRSCYSVDAEIATINNQNIKPEEYAAYQAFRAEAKVLADGWLTKQTTE